jgi:actin-like ATPase involved in cell morphogenesis
MGQTEIFYPFKDGVINDQESYEQIFDYLFDKKFMKDPSECTGVVLI